MSLLDPDCPWPLLLGNAAPSPAPASPAALQEGPNMADAECAPAPPAGQLPMAWFRDHFDTLWRLALRLGVPQHSVDDVVQEAFIICSRRHADVADGQERRFLIGTLVRVCSNYRQRASVRR